MPSEEKLQYSKYSGSSRRLNDAPLDESYNIRNSEITDVTQLRSYALPSPITSIRLSGKIPMISSCTKLAVLLAHVLENELLCYRSRFK